MAVALRCFITIVLSPFALITVLLLETFWRPLINLSNIVRTSKGCLKCYIIFMFLPMYLFLMIFCLMCSPFIFLLNIGRFLNCNENDCCCCECCVPQKKPVTDTNINNDIPKLFFYTDYHCISGMTGDGSNVYSCAGMCISDASLIRSGSFIKCSIMFILPFAFIFVLLAESFYRPIWIIKELFKAYTGCVKAILIIFFPFFYLFLMLLCLPSSFICIIMCVYEFCEEVRMERAIKELFFYSGGHCVNSCFGVESRNIYGCFKHEPRTVVYVERNNNVVPNNNYEMNNVNNNHQGQQQNFQVVVANNQNNQNNQIYYQPNNNNCYNNQPINQQHQQQQHYVQPPQPQESWIIRKLRQILK
jgi:hypothetical protein